MRLLPLPLVLLVGCVDAEQLADRDGDGFPSVEANCANCTDCDDADPDIHPDAEEICDDVDNDCDGDVDSDATDRSVYYVDGDGDGVGAAEVRACTLPDDASVTPGDCDDADPTSKPGGTEVCDGADNDCDGQTDEQAIDPEDWYADSDGDTYGDADDTESSCDAPSGYVADDTDCNDGDAGVNPGATEVAYNDIDEDCSGADLVDVDGDGYDAVEAGGDDCDDGDVGVNPGADETWDDGFTDNDCDGGLETALQTFDNDVVYGPYTGGYLGTAVIPLHDVDGDGNPEFLASAAVASVGHAQNGAVLLMSTSTGSLTGTAIAVGGADQSFINATSSSDVDGDGLREVLVNDGSLNGGNGGVHLVGGAAWQQSTVTLASDSSAQVTATTSGTLFGSVESGFIGDTDGDGIDEFAVGAPQETVGGLTNAGALYVFPGDLTTTQTTGDAERTFDGGFADAGFGGGTTSAGDQNGDGYDDFFATYGSGNVAVIISGTASDGNAEDAALHRLVAEVGSGPHRTRMVGDVNGDGAPDMVTSQDETGFQLWTNLAAQPVRGTDSPAAINVEIDSECYTGRPFSVADRDGDGGEEVGLVCTYSESTNGAMVTLWPSSTLTGAGVHLLSEAPLSGGFAVTNVAFPFRTAVVGDVDGDGASDIAFGSGGTGTAPGAVTTISVPQ